MKPTTVKPNPAGTKLRDYKGYTFYDAGQVEGGEPGDMRLMIMTKHGEVAYESIFFSTKDLPSLNKAIEKAKEWVDEHTKGEVVEDPLRYSDEALAEFKGILDHKLEAAKKEEEYLATKIKSNDNPDRQPTDPLLTNDEISQMSAMLKRQQEYILHLMSALTRIGNKTYGICRVTGKLIDSNRLRAVPHATLSMEAKQMMNKEKVEAPVVQKEVKEKPVKKSRSKPTIKTIELPTTSTDIKKDEGPVFDPIPERKCRVCGCTQDNCQQCVEKTGSPCHWVEPDLCSACEVVPEVKVTDSRAVAEEVVEAVVIPGEVTNFFGQLRSMITGRIDVTLRIMEKDGILTVGLFPALKSKQKPVNMVGTSAELDEGFFTSVIPHVKDIPGMVSNIEEVKNEAKKNADNSKPPARKHVKRSRPVSKKKAVVKKPAPKPKPTKKAAPKKSAVKKPGPKPGTKYKTKPGPVVKEPVQGTIILPENTDATHVDQTVTPAPIIKEAPATENSES